MATQRQSRNRRLNMAERAKQQMDIQFPGHPDALLWHRKLNDGYSTIPRTLPLAMQAIDAQSKGQPAGHTLLCLWIRAPDHPFLTIEAPATVHNSLWPGPAPSPCLGTGTIKRSERPVKFIASTPSGSWPLACSLSAQARNATASSLQDANSDCHIWGPLSMTSKRRRATAASSSVCQLAWPFSRAAACRAFTCLSAMRRSCSALRRRLASVL